MNQSNWNFKSESSANVIYTVQHLDKNLICNCPSFAHSKNKDCRHIKLVKNNLVGIAINQEPALVSCAVSEVRVDGKNILVPKFHNIWDRVKIIYQLRQLGISKRTCNEYFGDDYGSDKEIEGILRQIGYFKRKVSVKKESIKVSVPAFALVRC